MPNPVEYAEQVLGVHSIFEHAKGAHEEYDRILGFLDAAMDKRRVLDTEVEAREIDLLIQTRATHSDWSKTAVNEHQREARHNDPELRKLKGSLNGLNAEIAGLEADAKAQEFLLNVYVARMNELGGYLTFLAACKNEQNNANNSPT